MAVSDVMIDEFKEVINVSNCLIPCVNGENNENVNPDYLNKPLDAIEFSSEVASLEEPSISPDIFDDEDSPQSKSRYGRTRKQKVISDAFLMGSKFSIPRKGEKSPSKSPPEKMKTPIKKSPDQMNMPNGTNDPIWNTPKKAHNKVYIKKDFTQKNEDREETENLMRSMFSPVKPPLEPSPEKPVQTPLDKIILKKSPQGIFECSPVKSEPASILNYSDGVLNGSYNYDGDTDFEAAPFYEQAPEEAACNWKMFELAWARVTGHPFWPCIITRDPFENKYARVKYVGRAAAPSYVIHVTFFADGGRHSWLSKNLLIPFSGLDDFNRLKSEITPEMRKKDPKYCASFDIKLGKETKWSAAVSEAELFLRRPIELREEQLTNLLLSTPMPAKKTVKSVKKERSKPKSGDISLSESLFDSLFSNGVDENSAVQNGTLEITPKNATKKKSSKVKKQSQLDKYLVVDTKKIDVEPCNDAELDDAKTKSDLPCIKSENVEVCNNNIENGLEEKDDLKCSDGEATTPSRRNLRKRGRDLPDKHNESNDSDKEIVYYIEEIQLNADGELKEDRENDKGKSQTKSDSKYTDPEFVKFLELKRDAFMDDNPDLNEDDILLYLYKVWQYGESQMSDEMKCNSVCLVKGMADEAEPTPPKRTRRAQDDSNCGSPVSHKDKPSRKNAVKSYYCDNDSDGEDNSSGKLKNTDIEKSVVQTDVKDDQEQTEEIVAEPTDVYMEMLKQLKPNIFKGLTKEKICEICECTGNLRKCLGPCQRMFHLTCAKTQRDPVQLSELAKRKKRRGRSKMIKLKKDSINGDATDDTESGNSQGDLPNSDTDKEEYVSMVLPGLEDADVFESQLSKKMAEIMESTTPISFQSIPGADEDCDWNNIQAGECVIVDSKFLKPPVNLKRKADEIFKCNDCLKYEQPLCFICNLEVHPKDESDVRQRCSVIHCHKYYHLECLKAWPQTKYSTATFVKNSKNDNVEAITCPRHVCHTCVSDDPQGCKSRFSTLKIARCIKCPATYHSFTKCIPAGTKLITATQILCPRHYDTSGKSSLHVNTAWCFICAKGGMLVCCETCPTSFHAECLNIPLPEGGYICEDCETGRLPLYGELVWVKLGQYRWWPALVLHPSEIPPNINALPHSHGQFAVRFFGLYDHYWVNSGRVFPYQEGDTGNASSRKSSVDTVFMTAIKQAQQAYDIIKEMKSRASDEEDHMCGLLPPKYVKLKVNRPVGNTLIIPKISGDSASSKCDCNPNSERPCAPETDCLNRMLLTECSPNVCAAGERCCNQAFEKRLYPPLEPSRTSSRGWGLKTLADIKKGQFVIEYVGEVIDEEEFQRRMKRHQEMRDENYYFLTLDKDRMIDAGPKGNVARFMNHSCEPNCETQKWTVNGDVRVGLFALEDIPGGSEVTFNYNLACAGDEKKQCLCGTRRCAGYIGAKPLQDEPPRKLLKRKYKKKNKNMRKIQIKKDIRKRGRPRKSVLMGELEGIDRDVEIINQSLLEMSNDDDNDIESDCKPKFEESSLYDEQYDTKTEIYENDDVKTPSPKKAVKRKRSSIKIKPEPNLNNSVHACKRTRSNSVHLDNSIDKSETKDQCFVSIPVLMQNGTGEH